MLYIFNFFFNDTATTEIYTYRHTLSLHDALPISSTSSSGGRPRGESSGWLATSSHQKRKSAVVKGWPSDQRCPWRSVRVKRRRSEEHTSELQSLMRISYAVFCLKKKK